MNDPGLNVGPLNASHAPCDIGHVNVCLITLWS